MNHNHDVYIIDAGNTILKIAQFSSGSIVNVHKIELSKIDEFIITSTINRSKCFGSSVLSSTENELLKQKFTTLQLLNKKHKLPIHIKYDTPETLGIDRICNVVAATVLSNGSNCLTIDIGTCIKFDFIDAGKNYFGGSIGPGIDLRFKSMNDYTKNLPLIKEKHNVDLIGKSTSESMQSGVMNGIQAEINDFIQRYCNKYLNLNVFMTGGDAKYFDFPLKNNTFVDENLTLKGLYHIYILNEA
jgi:type III pantothenate kinase